MSSLQCVRDKHTTHSAPSVPFYTCNDVYIQATETSYCLVHHLHNACMKVLAKEVPIYTNNMYLKSQQRWPGFLRTWIRILHISLLSLEIILGLAGILGSFLGRCCHAIYMGKGQTSSTKYL